MEPSRWTELAVETCDLCGSVETRVLDDRAFVVECTECGFIFVARRPTVETIAHHYGEQHYEAWIEEAAGRRVMWRKRWERVAKGTPPGRWLDVGCGLGTFLQFARESGWEVHGTELSRAAAEAVCRQYGLDVHQGRLESKRFPDAWFDAVSLWHVLEHLHHPSSTVAEVRRILKPGGLLVVAVPNASNWKVPIKRLIGRAVYRPLWECREIHLSHFTPRTLPRMLERAGFHVLRLDPDDFYPKPSLLTDIRYHTGRLLAGLTRHLATTTMCAVAVREREQPDA